MKDPDSFSITKGCRLTSSYSGQTSDLQRQLADLVAENRRLALDGAHRLESHIEGVRDMISQMKSEMEHNHSKLQSSAKATLSSMSTDTDAMMQPSEIMRHLSDKLASLAEEVGITASNQTLLASLWFSNINERQTNVVPSHQRTFEWVLDPSSSTKLEQWLRTQNGIYWISGKAGSGKSTLVKFLLDQPQTKGALKEWAGSKNLVSASFFFWNAGTVMQKSQKGLFSSLLFEILRQCPNLIQSVCSSKAKSFRPYESRLEPWTQQELRHAIDQFKQESGVTARFCFFIDGLDEYDGESNQIIEVLENLRESSDIKLCISSRPWNEFRDAFGRPCDSQLALEDLTQDDIRVYVRDTLEENSRFRGLKARDSRSQELVQEIVEKARGVFLWVVLVVKSLLSGLQNADRILDLQKRLRNFPETLEKYFSNMFHSIDPIYREETAQAFKFALEVVEPLSLLTYSFLDEENLDAVLSSSNISFLTKDDIFLRQDDMRRRLNGRCKGLLEVAGSEELSHYGQVLAPKVDFLHRTVYDFLITKDLQQMLHQNLKADFEPKLHLCKAFLAQLKMLDRWPQDLLEDLVFYAHGLEEGVGKAQSTLMDEVGNFFPSQKMVQLDYLEFLVHRQHHVYVAEFLARRASRTKLNLTALLGSALTPQPTKHFNRRYDSTMIRTILENGAQPNGYWNKITPWSHFLQAINTTTLQTPEAGQIETIEALLLHGAKPQLRVVIGQRTRPSPRSTGRAADLHRSKATVENEYRTAEAILRQVLGDEKTNELLEKAVPARKSLLARFTNWIV